MVDFKYSLPQKVDIEFFSIIIFYSLFIDPIKENGEIENHRPMLVTVNHNHKGEEEEEDGNIDEQSSNKNLNGINSINELIEAQKQLVLLREHLNETMGN